MGIESFLTASSVDCVVAQRLARKLCTHCKRASTVPGAPSGRAGFPGRERHRGLRGGRLRRCSQTGYRGRVGLFSVMVMSEQIKDMAVSPASEAEIAQVARQEGMVTLKEDGLDKVRAGLTSIEEVARVAT